MTGAEPRTNRTGMRLREAREARGLSLRQISDATKLSVRVLSALEDHRLDDLPEGIYRRAAVRNYAREVGLEEEPTLLAFLREHPDHLPLPGTAMAMLTRPSAPSLLPRVFGWLGVVVPAVASVAYLVLAFGVPTERRPVSNSNERPTSAEASGVAQRVAYVAPDSIQLTLTTTAPTRVTVVSDGEVSVDEMIAPGSALDVQFIDTVELRASNGAAVHIGAAGAAGRLVGAAGGPQTLTLTRETYADVLRLR